MYNVYNDMTGRKCSNENVEAINYDEMERMYVRGFIQNEPPCPPTTVATTRPTTTEDDYYVYDGGVVVELPDPVNIDNNLGMDGTTRRRRVLIRRTTLPFNRRFDPDCEYCDDEEYTNKKNSAFNLVIPNFVSLLLTAAFVLLSRC